MEHLDIDRYNLALSICALEHDIKLFSGGDETEIGEKGKLVDIQAYATIAFQKMTYFIIILPKE